MKSTLQAGTTHVEKIGIDKDRTIAFSVLVTGKAVAFYEL